MGGVVAYANGTGWPQFFPTHSSGELKMPRYPKKGTNLDHFKIYEIDEIDIERNPLLQGQFDRCPKQAEIKSIIWFANPVQKNKEKIVDKNAHFLGYSFLQAEPKRHVEFSNQFGKQKVTIQDSAVLLVPVEKFEDNSKFPDKLDHFKCYVVQKPKALKLKPPITLSDQFDKKRGCTETIVEISPAFFCVPVDKNGEKIKNPNDHLVIYDISPRDVLNPPINIMVSGQFGTVPLAAKESILLAVPSRKLDWKEGNGYDNGDSDDYDAPELSFPSGENVERDDQERPIAIRDPKGAFEAKFTYTSEVGAVRAGTDFRSNGCKIRSEVIYRPDRRTASVFLHVNDQSIVFSVESLYCPRVSPNAVTVTFESETTAFVVDRGEGLLQYAESLILDDWRVRWAESDLTAQMSDAFSSLAAVPDSPFTEVYRLFLGVALGSPRDNRELNTDRYLNPVEVLPALEEKLLILFGPVVLLQAGGGAPVAPAPPPPPPPGSPVPPPGSVLIPGLGGVPPAGLSAFLRANPLVRTDCSWWFSTKPRTCWRIAAYSPPTAFGAAGPAVAFAPIPLSPPIGPLPPPIGPVILPLPPVARTFPNIYYENVGLLDVTAKWNCDYLFYNTEGQVTFTFVQSVIATLNVANVVETGNALGLPLGFVVLPSGDPAPRPSQFTAAPAHPTPLCP